MGLFRGSPADVLFGKKQAPTGTRTIPFSKQELFEISARQGALAGLDKSLRPDIEGKSLEPDVEAFRGALFGQVKGREREETRAARGLFGDQSRRLRDIIAQRGLGTSAVGISQQLGIDKDLSENLANIRARSRSQLFQLPLALIRERERLTAGRRKRLADFAQLTKVRRPQQVATQRPSREGGLFDIAIPSARTVALFAGSGGAKAATGGAGG